MKPSFALVLTQETIGLLHRTAQGWHPVGEAQVSDPDLTAALASLRGAALDLDPAGIFTKLVIPNSEILYTKVEAPGPSASARRSQIRAALEGRTPYAVSELVFDWSGKGSEVKVAVVARETLQEAEAFALQHGLGPLSLVGTAEEGVFDGEPWFGPTSAAADLLPPGEKVERDQSPVPMPAPAPVIARPEPSPDPVPAPEVPVAAEGSSVAAGDSDAKSAPEIASALGPALDPLPEPEPGIIATPEVLPAETAAAPSAPAEPEAAAGPTGPLAASAQMPPAFAEEQLPAAAPPVAPQPVEATRSMVGVPAAEVPEVRVPEVRVPDVRVSAQSKLDDAQPPPLARTSRADVIAQSLEVPPEDEAVRPARSTAGQSAPAIERLKARLAEQPTDQRRFGAPVPGHAATPPPLGSASAGSGSAAPPAAARALKAVPGPAVGARPGSAGSGAGSARPAPPARSTPKGGLRGAATMVTSPSIPLPRDRRVNIPSAEAAAEARARAGAEGRKAGRAEGEGLTSFGGKQVRRGKPKYLGLILTGVLLIVLAAVAAWSTYFMASDEAPGTVPAAAALPEAAAPASSAAATGLPDGSDTAALLPDGGAPAPAASAAGTGDSASPAASAPRDAVAEPVPGMTRAPPASPFAEAAQGAAPGALDAAPAADASATTVATSGASDGPLPVTLEPAVVAQPEATAGVGRNPVLDPQNEIFLAMTDPAVPIADPVALAPPVAATDPAPAAQPLPPPFGTVYRFDADGLILPTAEGIVTPEGVRLVAGKPPRVPPPRPVPAEPALAVPAQAVPAQAVPAQTEAASAETAPAEPVPAEPVLSETAVAASDPLPVAAPEANGASAASVAGLIAPPAAPVVDASTLVPDPALAGARPRPRPADLVPASDDDAALPIAGDTQLTSLRPRLRPAALLTEAAAPAEVADETAALQSAAASLAAEASGDTPVSPLAIEVSRRPAERPRDLSQAVEAAVASLDPAPQAQKPEEPVEIAAAPADAPRAAAGAIAQPEPAAKPAEDPVAVEIDEPEVATAAPDLPTRANVAKQATFRNAINMSRVNLIGVYGSASNRYALVRQPNGRYLKVEVGDRVDGGRVATISDRELSYVKNGRTVTLSLPRS